jgi:hypothetical protein
MSLTHSRFDGSAGQMGLDVPTTRLCSSYANTLPGLGSDGALCDTRGSPTFWPISASIHMYNRLCLHLQPAYIYIYTYIQVTTSSLHPETLSD